MREVPVGGRIEVGGFVMRGGWMVVGGEGLWKDCR